MTASDKWIEISLIVNGELAEAVADVFSRFAPQGVVVESTAIADDPDGEGHPTGPLRVCAYLPADTTYDEKRQRIEEALWYMGRISPLPDLQFRHIGDVDWVSAWRQHYQPILIGRQLVILPKWIEEYPQERIPIRIDPGMAFGTGTHPSTQLCLQLAEETISPARADGKYLSIIDIGCGSGILSIGALKLGAQLALGVDVDPKAVENARQNAVHNGVEEQLELGVGSVPEILSGRFSYRRASLIFANILTSVLIQLFTEGLAELMELSGNLILSGILDEQVEQIENVVDEYGLLIIDRRQMGDWVALLAQKPNNI